MKVKNETIYIIATFLLLKIRSQKISKMLDVVSIEVCTIHLVEFVGLAYQEGKDIVFRFIIEYSILMDFGS
jgi:hypothetical protein